MTSVFSLSDRTVCPQYALYWGCVGILLTACSAVVRVNGHDGGCIYMPADMMGKMNPQMVEEMFRSLQAMDEASLTQVSLCKLQDTAYC